MIPNESESEGRTGYTNITATGISDIMYSIGIYLVENYFPHPWLSYVHAW